MATPALSERVRIAPGVSDDVAAVMRVMHGAFGDRFGEAWTRSQLAGILPMSGVALTLACDAENKDVVGFSLTRTVADESELLLIGVLPQRQRQGIARLLLDEFLEQARNASVQRVHLEVREGNPATSLYSAAGFAAVGRRSSYYKGLDGSRFDALTFARKL